MAKPKLDAVTAGAVDLARAAAVETGGEDAVGHVAPPRLAQQQPRLRQVLQGLRPVRRQLQQGVVLEQFIAGKRGGSITCEVLFVPGDTNGQFVLMNAWLNGTKLTSGTLPKLSRSTGGPNLSGDAYVENFKWNVPDNDKQSATFNLRFTGNISYSAT